MFDKKKKIAGENILILGLGGVGYYLAKRLLYEEYAITVIESDSDRLKFSDGPISLKPGPIFISDAIIELIAVR